MLAFLCKLYMQEVSYYVSPTSDSYADETDMKYTTNILNWITGLLTLVKRKLRRMLSLSAIFKALLFKLDLQEVSLIQCVTNKSQREATHVMCKICVKAQNKYVSSWCVYFVSRDISLSKYGKDNGRLAPKSSSVTSSSTLIYINLSFN